MSPEDDDKPGWRDVEDPEWGEVFRRMGEAPAGCPPPELIQAAQAGVLPPAAQEAVSAHIANCVACGVLAESLDAVADDGPTAEESARMIERVRAATDRAASRRRPLRRWVPVAVAAALLGFTAWWLIGPAGRQPSVFLVETPVLLPPESRPTSGEARDLATALVPYRAGRFDEAIRSLTEFVERYPQSAYGHFYLGVARLAENDVRPATVALVSAERLAVEKSSLAQEVSWHLGVAYHRLGQDDKALPRLVALCREPGSGWAKACAAIREITPTVELHGVVTDADGQAMHGVRIAEHGIRFEPDLVVAEPTAFSTTSDDAGRYRLKGVPTSRGVEYLVRVSRPGYFTGGWWVTYAPEARLDVVLYPWRMLQAGETIRSRTEMLPLCDPDEPCQRYAVTAERTGTLEVSATTSDRAVTDLYVETPDGRSYGPQLRAPLQLALPVTAGSTLQIRVLSFKVPADFELRTQLR